MSAVPLTLDEILEAEQFHKVMFLIFLVLVVILFASLVWWMWMKIMTYISELKLRLDGLETERVQMNTTIKDMGVKIENLTTESGGLWVAVNGLTKRLENQESLSGNLKYELFEIVNTQKETIKNVEDHVVDMEDHIAQSLIIPKFTQIQHLDTVLTPFKNVVANIKNNQWKSHFGELEKEIRAILTARYQQSEIVIVESNVFGSNDEDVLVEILIFRDGFEKKSGAMNLLELRKIFLMDQWNFQDNYSNQNRISCTHIASRITCIFWNGDGAQGRQKLLKSKYMEAICGIQPNTSELIGFLNYWFHDGFNWNGEKIQLLHSLIFVYLQKNGYVPTIKELFSNSNLKIESYGYYGVTLSDSKFITYREIIFKIFSIFEYSFGNSNEKQMENYKFHVKEFFNFFTTEFSILSYEFNSFDGTSNERTKTITTAAATGSEFIDVCYGFIGITLTRTELQELFNFLKKSSDLMEYFY